jgi:AcrR family transcriptional regulator
MLRASNRELSAQRSAERTDTEQRVLMEALKLFAAHGFNATSMRMICAAADANPSSVYYYFGSKRGVLRGVCEFLFEPVQRERAELLAKAMAKSAGSQLDLHAILAAFIGPAIRLARHPRLGRLFNRLAGHLSTDPTPDVRTVIARIHDTAARDFIQAVRKACPDLADERLFIALQCTFGVLLYAQSDPGRIAQLSGLESTHVHPDQLIELVVRYTAGGLQALAASTGGGGTRPE